MKRLKFIVTCLISMALLTSVAFAAVPDGTVAIGGNSFDLGYANNEANRAEIIGALVNNEGDVLVKKFNGEWINNSTGGSVDKEDVPALSYKDAEGNVTNYAAGDGDLVPDDVTAPVITIAGVEEGASYNVVITPVATIDEEGTIEMSLNGEEYDGSAITAEGEYTLVVTAKDLTGNESTKTITFTIKTTAPAAPVVTGVENGKSYKSATPVFEGKGTLNGAAYVSGTVVNVEGTYVLVATVTDAAGNTSSTTVNFIIDKTAPIVLTSVVEDYNTLKITFNEPVKGTPVVKVDDFVKTAAISADGLSLTIDDAAGFSAATHVVLINGLTDLAGNDMIANTIALIKKEASVINNVELTSTGFKAGENQTVYFKALDQYGQVITSYAKLTFSASIGSYPLANPTIDANGYILVLDDTAIKNGVAINLVAKYENKVVGQGSINVTGTSATPTTIKSIDVTGTLQPTNTANLQVDVYDQYNRPLNTAAIKWVVSDVSKASFTGNASFKDGGKTETLTLNNSGSVTVTAYLMNNISVNISKTINIGELALNKINIGTKTYETARYNKEEFMTTDITPNAGANLTADMLKYKVTSGDASKISVVPGYDANNKLVLKVTTQAAGTYKFVPFVGASFDAQGVVKGDEITVTTGLNPNVVSIDDISFSSNELKVGSDIKKKLVFRNKHGEEIKQVTSDVAIAVVPATNLVVTKIEKDGKVDEVNFKASTAGTYQVTIAVGSVYDTYNLTFVDPTWSSIGNIADITGNVVAGDPVSKAVYGEIKFFDQDGIGMAVKRADLSVSVVRIGSAEAITYNDLIIFGKVIKDGNGKIIDINPASDDVDGYKVLASSSLTAGTYTVSLKKKDSNSVPTKSFNVKVDAERFINRVDVTSSVGLMTLDSAQNITLEVKDQYGALIDAVGDINVSSSVADVVTVGTITKTAVGKYSVEITSSTTKKGSITLTFKTKKTAAGADEVSATAGITVKAIGDIVNSIEVTGTDKLYSSAAAGTIDLGLIAKDSNGNSVTINHENPVYVVWSATAKAANGTAIATGFAVDAKGVVTYVEGFVGTITVKATSSNFKTDTFDVRVDNAAPVSNLSTLVLKDGSNAVTSVSMKNNDAARKIDLYSKDQYDAEFTNYNVNDMIVMSADTTIVTVTKAAGSFTIAPVAGAEGSTRIYIQYKGVNKELLVTITKP